MDLDSTYYELLGVPRNASDVQIRTAYRKLLHNVHSDTGGTDALFRLVQQAYETLSDPRRRAAYDGALDGRGGSEGEAQRAEERRRREQARQEEARRDEARRDEARGEQARDGRAQPSSGGTGVSVAPGTGWTDVRFRPWNLLLLVPLISCIPPLFNSAEPRLGGLPFFYWFQLLVIPIGILCTVTVHLMTRHVDEEDSAAGSVAAEDPEVSR